MSVAEGDRLRLPGDAADSEVAAFWVEFGFMNMPKQADPAVSRTNIPPVLQSVAILPLTDIQRTTVTALLSGYLTGKRSGARFEPASGEEIVAMLERVPEAPGGGHVTRKTVEDRILKVRGHVMNAFGKDPGSARELAGFLWERGAATGLRLDPELAERMVDG